MTKAADRTRELESLHQGIRRCRRCPLHRGRRHAVPGEGPIDPVVMLIGEAPGAAEDLAGRPFCGRSGRFLDELLSAVGMTREQVFITSSVKCRPPHNRTPHADELAICRANWLTAQMDLVHCRRIVLLGAVAIRQVLGESCTLRDTHGQVRQVEGREILLTCHPAAGMRFPVIRQAMLNDFRQFLWQPRGR